ncbi:MAG: hypothetical protein MZU95_14140 [Desulfomicrobium escambiense]|nr:hypothetical protein [Desulfomicrobium escambiense]
MAIGEGTSMGPLLHDRRPHHHRQGTAPSPGMPASARRPRTTPTGARRRGLTIGDNNTFREFVTINRGTLKDRGVTTIGSHNLIMAYCHVAHDCIVGKPRGHG